MERGFSSPGYLVHLDGSLSPLQCGGVGLLQPQGQRLLKPLVEIAQSQRSIPRDEGTSFSNCSSTVTSPALTPNPPRDEPQTLLVMLPLTPDTSSLLCLECNR